MSDREQQPDLYDAVLGGQSPPLLGAVVLGGLEGVKQRLTNDLLEVKIAALQDALKYGSEGLKLAVQFIKNNNLSDQWRLYNLLWEKASDAEKKTLLSAYPHFEFETVILDASGQKISRKQGLAQYRTEDLGGGAILEMVWLPGGSFLMGSPQKERDRFNNESPQHSVAIEPFFMGKFAIAQAQWRVVAALPEVNVPLNPDPSYFKGDNLPVDNISWYDAIEFCARLSRKTGRIYRLPCEAEWEYAARAGTTTAFHFGETITSDLANYYGSYNYAFEAQGIYRQHTTPVGSFLPNAFGLYDMHGNVWEWCADAWHSNYNDAPSRGRIWQGGDNYYRMLRGGAWSNPPNLCRAANRYISAPSLAWWSYGFRVAVSDGWALDIEL